LLQKYLSLQDENKLPVFENEVLRKMVGHQECEGSGQFKVLITGIFVIYIYMSPTINRLVKLKMVRWVENVARTRQEESYDFEFREGDGYLLYVQRGRKEVGCEKRGSGNWLVVVPNKWLGISIKYRLVRIPLLFLIWNVKMPRFQTT
jgi:hypothetical protein